jgi:peroxiredoxin
MTDHNLSLTVAIDSDGKVTTKSYLIASIPSTFFIDKDGVIRQKKLGNFTSAAEIENELGKIMP